MYQFKKRFNNNATKLMLAATIFLPSIMVAEAATLAERAIYKVNVVVEADPTSVGSCSSFDFGDSSALCGSDPSVSKVTDYEDTNPLFVLSGGNGVLGDGFAGVFEIETAREDGAGNNTFILNSYQMDPYITTAGGTFKTSMTPPDAANNSTGGALTATGGMTLDLTGRAGRAASFVDLIGIQPWNIDDSVSVNVITTGVYQEFTTGNSVNYIPTVGGGGDPSGVVFYSLDGRAIGDANADGILDAILVSAGNVGNSWMFFDGTAYTEIYNVQFVLVSAKPVANDDTGVAFSDPVTTTLTIATDLLANDTHAEGDALVLADVNPLSVTALAANGSLIVDNGDGTLTYTPPTSGGPFVSDSFDYTVKDLDGNTDTATMELFFPSGDAPVAEPDFPASFDEDTPLTLDPIANDTDTDGGPLVLFDFDGVTANLGTVVAETGNSVTYTPPANYFGTDTFDYVVHDGNGNLVTGTVTLTVDSVNDPVTCLDIGLSTTTDMALDIGIDAELLSTCTDADTADTISLASWSASSAEGGSVSSDGTTLTYTPALGFSGTDTFTYTANDGTADDVVARTVTMTVGNFGNFTMLKNGDGQVFGGTNDVIFDWDNTTNTDEVDYTQNLNFNMSIISSGPFPFYGAIWTAHSVRVFGPGTYSFDSGCTTVEITTTGSPAGSAANSGPAVTMTVGDGQLGGHILFDFNGSFNIDVLNVWDIDGVWADADGDASIVNNLFTGPAGTAPDPTTTWKLVSRDVNSDGINGMPMVDGPYIGYYANFSDSPAGTAPPLEDITGTTADTRLGSGAVGLASLLAMLPLMIFLRRRFRK